MPNPLGGDREPACFFVPSLEVDEPSQTAPFAGSRPRWLDLGSRTCAAHLADYRREVEVLKEDLAKATRDEKVGFVRIKAREFRIYGNVGYTAVLYDQGLDLTPPDLTLELAWGKFNETVSLEVLPRLADADHLFVSVDGEEQEDAAHIFRELQLNPLWQNLPAAQQGNVYPVERRVWLNYGLLANKRKLEDIVSALGRDD